MTPAQQSDLIRQSNSFLKRKDPHNHRPQPVTSRLLSSRRRRRAQHQIDADIVEIWPILYPFLPQQLAKLGTAQAK